MNPLIYKDVFHTNSMYLIFESIFREMREVLTVKRAHYNYLVNNHLLEWAKKFYKSNIVRAKIMIETRYNNDINNLKNKFRETKKNCKTLRKKFVISRSESYYAKLTKELKKQLKRLKYYKMWIREIKSFKPRIQNM